MAVTITRLREMSFGAGTRIQGYFRLTGTYPTGGIVYNPDLIGIGIGPYHAFAPTAGYYPQYNPLVIDWRLQLWIGDYTNAADGPLVELANGTSVNGLVIPFMALNYD
jgi:hypothetical protein